MLSTLACTPLTFLSGILSIGTYSNRVDGSFMAVTRAIGDPDEVVGES